MTADLTQIKAQQRLDSRIRNINQHPVERIKIMQTEHLSVTGMTCGGCASTVTKALKSVAGVSGVKVSVATGEATVQYDEGATSPDKLKSAITSAGYGVNASGAALSQPVKGGCCS